jgi:2,3-bisphosphoglycerate-dependent phosphoglycerate mutase
MLLSNIDENFKSKHMHRRFIMSTEIYMVRHAHSNYSSDESGRGVSEKAKKDIELVTELLIGENIDVVISRPYRRAIETVEGAAKALGLNIELEERFKERVLSEVPVKDFELSIKSLWDDPNLAYVGGETNTQAAQRGIAGLIHVIDKHNGKKIAVGVHGNLMVIIMNYFNGKYDYSFWKNLSMPDIYRLSFENHDLIEVKRIWKG